MPTGENPKSKKNLKMWKKGQSGNPKGPKKNHQSLRKVLQKMMEVELPVDRIPLLKKHKLTFDNNKVNVQDALVACDIVDALIYGKDSSRKRLYEYSAGKPSESVSVKLDAKPFIIKTPIEDIHMGVEEKDKDEE